MAITKIGSNSAAGTGTTASVTHGLAINENDFVVCLVGVNGTGKPSAASFAKDIDYTQTNSSATATVFSKTASASEPATYDFSLSAADRWAVIVIVFRGGGIVWDVLPSAEQPIADTSQAISGITTISDDTHLIGFVTSDTDSAIYSSLPAGYALIQRNGGQSAFIADKAQAVAGATGDVAYTVSGAFNAVTALGAIKETGAVNSPTITNINTTNEVTPGEAGTITGTNFGATQGAGGLTIGGVTQTIASWSDTSITFTTVLGNNNYGTGKTLEVTTDAAGTASDTVELVANTAGGFGVVTMSSPNTSDEASVAFGATPTVVTGDQFEWEDFNNLGNLTVDAQGFVTNVDTEGTFRGRFWDATDSTWGAVETFTAEVPDSPATPDNSGLRFLLKRVMKSNIKQTMKVQ